MRISGWGTGFLFCCLLMASGSAAAQQPIHCLYGSRAYSEGAFICVQKSLMLSCSPEGARVVWKAVADKELNDRCEGPTVTAFAPAPRPPSRRAQRVREQPTAKAAVTAKCFTFNGKRYCE